MEDVPEVYRRQPGVLHTSSDGQKFAVAVDSRNANYSFKYFGQDKRRRHETEFSAR